MHSLLALQVAEINRRYDVECVPNAYRGNKQAYIKDSAISKNCTLEVKVVAITESLFLSYLLSASYVHPPM